MSEDNLKSCPFCGSNDVIAERHLSRMDKTFYPTCANCGAVGQYGKTKEEATLKWNTRQSPESKKIEEALGGIDNLLIVLQMRSEEEHIKYIIRELSIVNNKLKGGK